MTAQAHDTIPPASASRPTRRTVSDVIHLTPPSPLTLLPPPAQPVVQLPAPRDEPAPPPWPSTRDLGDIFGPGAAR